MTTKTPTAFNDPIYHDEDAARAHFEHVRWPNGPVCYYCETSDQVRPLNGESMGPGWYYCANCKDKFTARMGTVLERSHVAINKWLLAMRLMASSKKGISAHQLHRTLKVTYKTAWFLAHRIREAMKDDGTSGQLGGEGKTVEADETFYGPQEYEYQNERGWVGKRGTGGKMKVLTLVEREGRARSVKVDQLTAAESRQIILDNISAKSRLVTDEAKQYPRIGREFSKHETVKHRKKEYARGDVTTNTVEGYFSVLKRGLVGTYQHVSEQHLQRYLQEFDFRYSNRAKLGVDDAERTTRTIKGVAGKRLTYRRTDDAPQA